MNDVTVCIPTIPPRKDLLARALASVEAQTKPPKEVIVIEDLEGLGAGPTRNKCWQAATTTYVAFLDDDDEFMPKHLEKLMRTAQRTNADLVYSWFDHRGWPEWTAGRPDPLGVAQAGRIVHPLGVPFGKEQEQHLRKYAFIPITTLVKRRMLVKSGGFPTPGTPEWPHTHAEDWGGWLRLLDVGAKFAHHPERTWILHHSGDGRGGTAGLPWKEQLNESARALQD